MTPDELELHDMYISLRAEISALKEMMCESSPDLANKHQELADRYRVALMNAWHEQHKEDLVS